MSDQIAEPDIVMDAIEVQAILPHRYPFLLVDRVVEFDSGRRAVGLKNVTVNDPYFQGHFPGRPVFPGVLIVEALAQLGGVLAIRSSSVEGSPIVYLTGIDKAKFRKPVIPGDQIRLEVEVIKRRPPFWKMQGKAFVGNDLVCEAESTAMLQSEQADFTGAETGHPNLKDHDVE
ncbi:MAG: 3-hydroxyacyl-ACP dehydratase FabZ [Nitrospira sp.]|nr:3-hydroxyacyl-ACP dehydratase FabZ [Nitrospira sp.]